MVGDPSLFGKGSVTSMMKRMLLLLTAVIAAAADSLRAEQRKRMLGNSARLFVKSGKSKSSKSNHSHFADQMQKIKNIERELQYVKDDLKETLLEASRILIAGGALVKLLNCSRSMNQSLS
jgi:hypothetical protein